MCRVLCAELDGGRPGTEFSGFARTEAKANGLE